MQAVKEEEEAPPPLPAEAPPRPPAAAPVSKWTLVDYDEDNPPADLEGCAVTLRTSIFIYVSILALFPVRFCDVQHLLWFVMVLGQLHWELLTCWRLAFVPVCCVRCFFGVVLFSCKAENRCVRWSTVMHKQARWREHF